MHMEIYNSLGALEIIIYIQAWYFKQIVLLWYFPESRKYNYPKQCVWLYKIPAK